MQHLASAVPQLLQHERGGAYWQTKAFQTSQLSPNSHLFPNKTTTCGSVYRAKGVNDEDNASERPPVNVLKESPADEKTCGDRYRIEHAGRWLGQRVAILTDQPVCSVELDEQPPVQVFFANTSSSFSLSLQQRWPLRLGLAR